MSAQLSKPNRKPFASRDWFKGTDEDYKREASSYIAYTGEFHVDEQAKTLTHSMFVSLFPNWSGQTQGRVVKIEGDETSPQLGQRDPVKRDKSHVPPKMEAREEELEDLPDRRVHCCDFWAQCSTLNRLLKPSRVYVQQRGRHYDQRDEVTVVPRVRPIEHFF